MRRKRAVTKNNRTKKTMSLLILVLLMFACFSPTIFAVNAVENKTTEPEKTYTADEAFRYALAPDHLLPFIFNNRAPFVWVAVDTSDCVTGRLYVYNKLSDETIEITDEIVTSFSSTNDYLYYTTVEQKIFETDYAGEKVAMLYQSTQGEIGKLNAFGNLLYFIEDNKNVIVYNTISRQVEIITTQTDISSVYMFDFGKIICYHNDEKITYFNAVTQGQMVLANNYELNCIINEASSTVENFNESYAITGNGLLSYAYNDIDFPLDEYPADLGTNWTMPTVRSYFTTTYAGSNQCDGFAKYAHDRFFHLYNANRTSPSWQNGASVTADHHGALPNEITNPNYIPGNDNDVVQLNSTDSVREFFSGLSKGAFLRYISRSDSTPYNGTHSIVFAGMSEDGTGIYAYEANQDGQCGVGYQKYTFAVLDNNYTHVLHYVNHNFLSTGTSENSNTHLVYCQNCDGYLRETHKISISKTALKHTRSCTTCSWYETSAHTFSYDACTVCGYRKGDSVVVGIGEDLNELL